MLWWLLMSCVLRNPELLGMEVESVSVSQVSSAQAAALLGVRRIDAELEIRDTEGGLHYVPVRGSGFSAGVLFNFQQDATLPWAKPRATLEVPSGLPAHKLFGVYRGPSACGAWLFGAETLTLRDRQGCTWSQRGPVLGFGMWFGGEWIWMRPAPHWNP